MVHTSFKMRLTTVAGLMLIGFWAQAGADNLQMTYQKIEALVNSMQLQVAQTKKISNTYRGKVSKNIAALQDNLARAKALAGTKMPSDDRGVSLLIELTAAAANTGAIHSFSTAAKQNIVDTLHNVLNGLTDERLINNANFVLSVLEGKEVAASSVSVAPQPIPQPSMVATRTYVLPSQDDNEQDTVGYVPSSVAYVRRSPRFVAPVTTSQVQYAPNSVVYAGEASSYTPPVTTSQVQYVPNSVVYTRGASSYTPPVTTSQVQYVPNSVVYARGRSRYTPPVTSVRTALAMNTQGYRGFIPPSATAKTRSDMLNGFTIVSSGEDDSVSDAGKNNNQQIIRLVNVPGSGPTLRRVVVPAKVPVKVLQLQDAPDSILPAEEDADPAPVGLLEDIKSAPIYKPKPRDLTGRPTPKPERISDLRPSPAPTPVVPAPVGLLEDIKPTPESTPTPPVGLLEDGKSKPAGAGKARLKKIGLAVIAANTQNAFDPKKSIGRLGNRTIGGRTLSGGDIISAGSIGVVAPPARPEGPVSGATEGGDGSDETPVVGLDPAASVTSRKSLRLSGSRALSSGAVAPPTVAGTVDPAAADTTRKHSTPPIMAEVDEDPSAPPLSAPASGSTAENPTGGEGGETSPAEPVNPAATTTLLEDQTVTTGGTGSKIAGDALASFRKAAFSARAAARLKPKVSGGATGAQAPASVSTTGGSTGGEGGASTPAAMDRPSGPEVVEDTRPQGDSGFVPGVVPPVNTITLLEDQTVTTGGTGSKIAGDALASFRKAAFSARAAAKLKPKVSGGAGAQAPASAPAQAPESDAAGGSTGGDAAPEAPAADGDSAARDDAWGDDSAGTDVGVAPPAAPAVPAIHVGPELLHHHVEAPAAPVSSPETNVPGFVHQLHHVDTPALGSATSTNMSEVPGFVHPLHHVDAPVLESATSTNMGAVPGAEHHHVKSVAASMFEKKKTDSLNS